MEETLKDHLARIILCMDNADDEDENLHWHMRELIEWQERWKESQKYTVHTPRSSS